MNGFLFNSVIILNVDNYNEWEDKKPKENWFMI